MRSGGPPRAHQAVAAFLCATAFVFPPAAAGAAEIDDDAPLIGEIQDIVSADGPHSMRLVEPLTSLAVLYRETDDTAFALPRLEQAVQILRINRGLHTLDQVPFVREIIRLEREIGDDEAAWDRREDLLALLRRYPNDLRVVPVLHELADEQMDILDEYLDHEKPPEVVFGCFYQEWPSADAGACRAGSRRTVVQGMLAEAQRNYADAIGALLSHGLYDSEELRELELDLLRGVDLLRTLYDSARSYPPPMVPGYLGASSIEPWRSRIAPIAELAEWNPDSSDTLTSVDAGSAAGHARLMSPYHRGRESLRRLHQYDVMSGRSLASQADSLVQLADWDLLYSRNGRAVDAYVDVYQMLAESGAPAASIEQLFAPPTPVVLPAFNPNPLAKDETREAAGYVDVAFEITRYGRARAIEIRDVVNAGEDTLDRLVDMIKGNRFRPRVANGEFPDAAPVLLRYYVYD